MLSGNQSEEEAPEPIRVPTADEEDEEKPAADGEGEPVEEEPADAGDQTTGSQGTSKPGSVQSIHVVDVGMDLPPAASDHEDYASEVKSHRTHSIPSVAGSVKSSHGRSKFIDLHTKWKIVHLHLGRS